MSIDEIEGEPKKVTRSPTWQVVYSNVTGLKFGDNDAQIIFGLDQDIAKPGTDVLEQVTVVMTPRSLKILAHLLSIVIENFESNVGPIPVSAEKLKTISDSVKKQGLRNKDE